MSGYLKMVYDKNTAAIMQILSKIKDLDIRPNNALLSGAVKQCCLRGIDYLCYEKFIYGKKNEDSLSRFKQNNGFVSMRIPQYYIPLTKKGSLVLWLGFHKDIKERLPEKMKAPLRDLHDKWYKQNMLK
jgi:hypothetical protein